MSVLVAFAITTLLMACCLWAGMRLTGVDGTFLAMLLIAAITTTLQLVPFVGWLIALVVMFALITKFTGADVWPDGVLMVIVANVAGVLATFMISGLA